jgi:hypothetical protein
MEMGMFDVHNMLVGDDGWDGKKQKGTDRADDAPGRSSR